MSATGRKRTLAKQTCNRDASRRSQAATTSGWKIAKHGIANEEQAGRRRDKPRTYCRASYRIGPSLPTDYQLGNAGKHEQPADHGASATALSRAERKQPRKASVSYSRTLRTTSNLSYVSARDRAVPIGVSVSRLRCRDMRSYRSHKRSTSGSGATVTMFRLDRDGTGLSLQGSALACSR
jgi:hypothetical protein